MESHDITNKLCLIARNCTEIALTTSGGDIRTGMVLEQKSRREDFRSMIELAEEALAQVKAEFGKRGIKFTE